MNIDPFFIRDFSGGMATDINTNIKPQNVVDLGLNMEFDHEIGSAASRLGTEIVGSQLQDNAPCLGIFQHVDQSDTTKNKLFAVFSNGSNNRIFNVTAGTASLETDTKDLETYFLNYNGDTLRLNGTDAPAAFDSTNWITTGGVFDLANMPTGYKYAAVFLNRVYLWGKASAPYTLAYSGLLTAGAVSWTSGNGTVQIEPEDNGGAPTGLAKVPGYVLIFKERTMHRWNKSSAFPEELVNIGAVSQKAIVQAGGLVAFFSNSNEDDRGFFITNGGRPQPISHDVTRPIKRWIDAIPTASEAAIAGWATNKGFAWSVGDLTVDGTAYANVVLYYNRIMNQWHVRSYPTQHRRYANYIVSGVNTIVTGDEDGTVYRIDKSATYSDNGTPIQYELTTSPLDFGYNEKKSLTHRVVVRTANAEGAAVSVVTDVEKIPLGTIDSASAAITIPTEIHSTSFQVDISGVTTNKRAIIQEIEIAGIDVHQNI